MLYLNVGKNHQSTPRNIPEEGGSHLHRGEALKSLTRIYIISLKGGSKCKMLLKRYSADLMFAPYISSINTI
jgi:hypothetical protein